LLTVLSAGGGTASADGGPHTIESGATPDKCASCHRIHTGQNEFLLKEASTVADFCYSCHGTGGPGSDLAAQEGTFYGAATPGPPYGGKSASTTLGLRAGGFDYARINTTDSGFETIGVLATPQPATSWHSSDGTTPDTVWGNGALNSGAGPTYSLECTSCHDPHGNGNYRILRSVPTGSSGAGTPTPVPVTIADQVGTKVYATDNYFNTGPVSGIQMASWCATCHTRYLASSTGVNSGDAIFTYRHRSNGSLAGTTCIKCHASHGSNASMPGLYSSTVPWPGGGSGTTDNNNSRLLKMDNRGICIKCHTDYGAP
jgi:predicted CXXCH cytochrome family protein